MQLALSQIRRDGGTQPRAELLIEVMEDYAEMMLNGVVFPPIVVYFDGKDYWLADGFHRVGAAERARPDQPIEAQVIQGTQSEAQWYSFGVNKTHGLRRNKEDRIRAIQAALDHPAARHKSDREIAEHVGVSKNTVASYRRKLHSGGQIDHLTNTENGESGQPSRRVGRDGKSYPARKLVTVLSDRKQNVPTNGVSPKASMPTRAPSLMEKMTAINVPHNPAAAARALMEVFGGDYCRSLIKELTDYLADITA